MEQTAATVATILTIVAALMTASNMGARVTGYGFAVFVAGSIAWIVNAAAGGQQGLLITNSTLLLINLLGVWRWLGRQAKYDEAGQSAAEESDGSRHHTTLMPLSAVAGSALSDAAGNKLGQIVDAMAQQDGRVAYYVVSQGGVAGLGERLSLLRPSEVSMSAEGATTTLDAAAIERAPTVERDNWPAAYPA